MSGQSRFVYGFEYEEHADAFLSEVRAAGHNAALEVRDDGVEAVGVIADENVEQELDRLAEQSFGHSLGARPASD